MAYLYVTEFGGIGRTGSAYPQAAKAPRVAMQRLSISGSAETSSAFNTNTTLVRVHTDAICSIKIALDPSNVAVTDTRMAADSTEYFAVPQTGTYKISVISNT